MNYPFYAQNSLNCLCLKTGLFVASFSLAFMIMIEEFYRGKPGVSGYGFLVGFELMLASFDRNQFTCQEGGHNQVYNAPIGSTGNGNSELSGECGIRSYYSVLAFCFYMVHLAPLSLYKLCQLIMSLFCVNRFWQ